MKATAVSTGVIFSPKQRLVSLVFLAKQTVLLVTKFPTYRPTLLFLY